MILGALIVFSIFGTQAKPDYSGTWVLNSAKSAKPIGQGLIAPQGEMILTVTDKGMTIVHRAIASPDYKPSEQVTGERREQTTVCAFGASPQENTRPMRPLLCSAKWDGDSLVITTSPKPYPNIAETTGPNVTKYTITGAELKGAVTTPHPNGKQALTSDVFYDKKTK